MNSNNRSVSSKKTKTASESHIQLRSLGSLKPNPRNARTHSPKQINQIASSIREFGFVGAIATNADGMILAGHGRYGDRLRSAIRP